MDYLEAFNVHLKVRKEHNGPIGYHPVLEVIVLQEKHNITSDTANEEQKTEENIKARERQLMCMFLSGSYNLRYKKLKIDIKNKYIMGMGGYPKELP